MKQEGKNTLSHRFCQSRQLNRDIHRAPTSTMMVLSQPLHRHIILEWTQLVCTPAPGSLFVRVSGMVSRHVGRNNYVPLFGVDPMKCRLTLLRNT